MSNALAPELQTHYSTDGMSTLCKAYAWKWTATEYRRHVTCKRCLASLDKRDREFQRKARGWFRRFDEPRMRCVRDGLPPVKRPSEASLAVQRERTLGGTPLGYRQVWDAMAAMAARATAREEGRAL